MTNITNLYLEKKAYELSYALFRLSGNLNRQPLGGYLENHSLSFFDSIVYGNRNAAVTEAKIIEYYLRLGGDIGIIHQDNVAVLIAEIGNINSAIAELNIHSGKPDVLNFQFSGNGKPETTRPSMDIRKKEIPAEVINKELEAIANTEEGGAEEEADAKNGDNQKDTSATRQSAIVDRIRQLPNCRMKDLIASFHDVSERTLRYDLEKLTEAGLIERMGQGGISTYYQAVD